MKKLFLFLLLLTVAGSSLFAQNHFEISKDPEGSGKIFKGIVPREALEQESSFEWMGNNRKGYNPNAVALNALKQYGDSLQLLVFMGTWCDDSHYILPKFLALIDAAGFAKNRLTLIGTDRNKRTLGHLCEALNVNNVPTIMVMKEGKELGRVIEYGKTGMWDKELGEVINAAMTN